MSETTTFAAQPLLWALAAAPLVLGLFAWLIWRQRKALEELRRVAAEVAVTAALDRFFTLSGDLLAIVDLDGHFRRLNPAW